MRQLLVSDDHNRDNGGGEGADMESLGVFLRHLAFNLQVAALVVVCLSLMMTLGALMGAGLFWLSLALDPILGQWAILVVLIVLMAISAIIVAVVRSAIEMLK
ncbi:hypothetical protein GN330_22730 [Nitratireductor sp. CAU 1489]|uniref:Uncharacterized protein n=1 Tax=Nitratireductor arenosus TaxID=2682096 RepID=A0A844QJK1_9HYPH|nr:hypothetical protein [Nitratireductor arenosus]MVB00067.1 hypothetical protein [Nitratireductor arenosus]